MKNVIVFDLDGTVIDSSHRTPNKPDGTLDLERYFKLRNRESIFRDTLLPLAKLMRKMFEHNYIIVCTSRTIDDADIDFMKKHNLPYHTFLSRSKKDVRKDDVFKFAKLSRYRNLRQFRNKQWLMFDDAIPVIALMRKIGIVCLNSKKINERLSNENFISRRK